MRNANVFWRSGRGYRNDKIYRMKSRPFGQFARCHFAKISQTESGLDAYLVAFTSGASSELVSHVRNVSEVKR